MEENVTSPRGEPIALVLLDPRKGDVEDDASSPQSRSMLAVAGSLLAEISLPKLALAWTFMIIIPGILLGLAPLVLTAWLTSVSARIGTLAGLWPLLVLALLLVAAWFGGRPVFRMVEKSFWSLNSLAVQPGYALVREGLRHLGERLLGPRASVKSQTSMRAASAAGGGLVACCAALVFLALAWPATRWQGTAGDLITPLQLLVPALANTVAVVSLYLAAASLVWGFADATMDQPVDLQAFDAAPSDPRRWRVAHLSDIHIVGERYGFRIESGRAGPRGNDRLERVFHRLAEIHAVHPLDVVLITGDMTDAGRSAEWAEFDRMLLARPALAARTLVLPGNHDVNIVDRANPARLDLPTSPGKRLRQMRTLSAMAAVQGERVRVLRADRASLGEPLNAALERHAAAIRTFADKGSLRLSLKLTQLWADVFPMILPPAEEDGLGVILLNSNAETHFSFTNALGLVSAEQALSLSAVTKQFPRARWLVTLHHHLVEYPKPAKAFSERIGTALINGSWFVRQLKPLGMRCVALHGHRHIDWIGACGPLRIISAPSPVMDATDAQETRFYIHTFAPGAGGELALLQPETVVMAGEPALEGDA
jgi:hypothetical protein